MDSIKASTEQDALRGLQLAELTLLKQFISFAEEHDIEWFAEGGTVLGAVRHQGFIPWDEDIDIGMPRKDYERFLQLAQTVETPFRTRSYRWEPEYNYGYARLEVPNVKVVRSYLGEEVEQFAWIDVSPMDGMPNNRIKFKMWVKYILFRRAIHSFAKFGEKTGEQLLKRIKNPVVRFTYKLLYRLKIYKLFDQKKEVRKLDMACAKYSNDTSRYYANIMGGSKDKDIYPVEVYGEGVALQFEDVKIRCPIDTVSYLSKLYGETYMDFPPESERHRHDIREIHFV